MADISHPRDLEWDELSGPVPLDLIDPDFQTHPTEAPVPSREPSLEPAAAESLVDEFSRLRAKMEVEVEVEKKAKLDADREEASQRARLDQWMANARARLLKADADLTGP